MSRQEADDSFDGLIGQTVDGRYRVMGRIGAGGMGVVYRVEHVRMGKTAAMKVLRRDLAHDGQAAKRFRREVEAVARLDHPNIVQTFDFGSWKGLLYLVMEYLNGEDMAAIIRRAGGLEPSRAVALFSDVCSALDEAHHQGIIHRDLKPDNIVCVNRRQGGEYVKVLDFGLAKLRERTGADVTGAGSLIGTPYYMAPEQVRSESVDERTDVYALGASLYRALTGSPPFKAATPMAVLSKHLTDEVEPPSERVPEAGLPLSLNHLVLKAMAKSPANRFQSAAQMREALQAVQVELEGAASGPVVPAPETLSVRTRLDQDRATAPTERIGPEHALDSFDASLDGSLDGSSDGSSDGPSDASLDTAAPRERGADPRSETSQDDSSLSSAGLSLRGAGVERRAPDAVESSHERLPEQLQDEHSEGPRTSRLRREDIDAFEGGLRRQRARAAIFAGLGVAAAIFLVVQFTNFLGPRASATEQEPNNDAATSTFVANGEVIYGHVGEPQSDGTPDMDYFHVHSEKKRFVVTAHVTAIADVDLVVELFDSTGKLLGKADAARASEPELIGPLAIGPLDAFIRVRSVWVQGEKPVAVATPYALTVSWEKPGPQVEQEPNDDPDRANPVELGTPLRGFLADARDEDAYIVEGSAGDLVEIEVAPGRAISGDDVDRLDVSVVIQGRSRSTDRVGSGGAERVKARLDSTGVLKFRIVQGRHPKEDEPHREQPYRLTVAKL